MVDETDLQRGKTDRSKTSCDTLSRLRIFKQAHRSRILVLRSGWGLQKKCCWCDSVHFCWFVSFLVTVDARTLLSQNKPFRQMLHDYQHVQYFADFKIGEQDIAGIFDTGSFERLVRSARCQHCAHPAPPYNHAKSLTYVKNGTVTKHAFGS